MCIYRESIIHPVFLKSWKSGKKGLFCIANTYLVKQKNHEILHSSTEFQQKSTFSQFVKKPGL